MARPCLYTPEVVAKVCELLSQGITLEEIGRMDDMPSANTLHDWKNPNAKCDLIPSTVAEDIARAREIGYDIIASRTRETARGKGDSSGAVDRDKLIIDTDLKLLAKWTKKYSDKSSLEVGGIDGNPIASVFTVKWADMPGDEGGKE